MNSLILTLLFTSTVRAKLLQFPSSRPEILTAELGDTGLEVPLCPGVNDLLPVTFNFPVVGEPSPDQFEVTVARMDGSGATTVEPACATLLPANEADELQTVLLFGQFRPSEDMGPVKVDVVGDLMLDTGALSPRSVSGRCVLFPNCARPIPRPRPRGVCGDPRSSFRPGFGGDVSCTDETRAAAQCISLPHSAVRAE